MSTAGPGKTAIERWSLSGSLSRPVALALEDGLLSKKVTFFVSTAATSDNYSCPHIP